MKINALIFLFSIFAFNIMADDLFDLNNDEVLDAIVRKGESARLTDEFNSKEAEKWLTRCFQDERLKREAYDCIRGINDVGVRYKLLVAQLRDHEYWHAGSQNEMRDLRFFYSIVVTDSIARDLPVFSKEKIDQDGFKMTLLSSQGRDAVAAALEKFAALPRDERSESNSKVQAVIADIQDAISKYGKLSGKTVVGIPSQKKENYPTHRAGPPTDEKSAPVIVPFVEHQEHKNPLLIGVIIIILVLVGWIVVKVFRKDAESGPP